MANNFLPHPQAVQKQIAILISILKMEDSPLKQKLLLANRKLLVYILKLKSEAEENS
jgi:hypothetical protein